MINFRNLEPEDIEVRIQQVTDKGCSLLLYKTARCDMRILDETVGQECWDCEYSSVNGYLFCTVGIRCTMPDGTTSWVYKSDTGTQSNMEPEKGHASDAFKRACTRWGIGRELYTSPFIWVDKGQLQKHHESNGRWKCNDRFSVSRVKVEDGKITDLAIDNEHGFTVYQMRSTTPKRKTARVDADKHETAPQNASDRFAKVRELKARAISLGVSEEGIEAWVAANFKGKAKKDMTDYDLRATEAYLNELIKAMGE
jgi:Uncharacterized protein conserved in bacteria